MEKHEVFISVIAGVALMLFLVIVFIMSVVRYNRKMYAHMKEKLSMQSHFQQTLLQTQLEIQEQTFKNISQEIHDNIGQVLSLVKLNINTMDRDKPEPLQEKIDNSRTLITKAIQDLRDLSKSLNTDYVIELGLMRSIEYELEMIQRTVNCEIAFTANGKTYRLERQQELILFRIVQEVLHNIIKHSKATAINVTAVFEPETFTLTIADNGIGFDAGKIEDHNYEGFGLGIRNMHNRAKMINADYKLTSTLQKGTTVTITLPLIKIIQS
jgi:two-component system NarL family sensor kinase